MFGWCENLDLFFRCLYWQFNIYRTRQKDLGAAVTNSEFSNDSTIISLCAEGVGVDG